MPGIVGFVSKQPRSSAKAQLAAMLNAVQHETFYSSGTWVDDSLGVYVGWTAVNQSFSDGMPLHNEQQDVYLVFSGEEYPDDRSVQRLRSHGHHLGSTESAYLVHLYEEDPRFVRNLNGMFHGLLIDRARGVVILFNDRYGMHRLYCHEAADGVYFATEAKAIVAARPELKTCDLQGLGDFVCCSCILENRTIFKGIHVLPPASLWTFRGGQVSSKNTYFDPHQWEEQPPLDAESYYQEIRRVLHKALPRYFAGPLKVGMAMTGGFDTRVILSCHPPAPGALSSYTFGSKLRHTYDVLIGSTVARLCGQPHQVIEVGDDFLDSFADYAERTIYITEGTVDLYRASDLYLSKKVRQIAPAKIVGTYGSEIVRHAVMFKPVRPASGVFNSEFLSYVQTAENTYSAVRQQHPVTFAAFRQSPWYHHGILALEQSQLTVRSPFMDNEFVRAVYRAPRTGAEEDIRLRLIRENSPTLANIQSDRGVSASGRRVAAFFARASREFTFRAEYAYDEGMPQLVARLDRVLSPLRPERLFLGRHKLLHFRMWYRDQLAEYVRQMLLDPLTLSRPYLNRKQVETLVENHLNGSRNYTTMIHKLIALELVQRHLLNGR